MMIAEARALALIPDDLNSAQAAPLLCAGVTTYNALRNSPARSGDLVAIQGLGGARTPWRSICSPHGISHGCHRAWKRQGQAGWRASARTYIDSGAGDAAAALQRLGGARVILATAPSNRSMGPLVAGLSTRGRLIIVGASLEPIEVSALPLIFGGRSIEGSLTGSAIDGQDTLSFSVLENVRPMIETMPLEKAADAFARMMSGEVRFRMVLTTGQ